MFSGLVELTAPVEQVHDRPPGKRLVVREATFAAESAVGDSIAVGGCCLTLVEIDDGRLAFDAGAETLGRTNLGELVVGARVNLERSLQVGDRLGGHFVTGHIDGVGTLDDRRDAGDWSNFWFRVPPRLTSQMVSKGSIAVEGVSLTLVDVEAERFSVALIPHTLAATTLGGLAPGGRVNIETDLLAKYAQKAVAGS